MDIDVREPMSPKETPKRTNRSRTPAEKPAASVAAARDEGDGRDEVLQRGPSPVLRPIAKELSKAKLTSAKKSAVPKQQQGATAVVLSPSGRKKSEKVSEDRGFMSDPETPPKRKTEKADEVRCMSFLDS
jgi:hypothetical protein